jgi:ribulose-bisphosphate carboxylase small chain
MSEIQDYKSSLNTAEESRRFETFSYLPELSEKSLRAQIQYIVDKGWIPSVEHTEPDNTSGHYWYMWKLPMFGETDVDLVLNELEQCHSNYPGNHVRLMGLDKYAQCAGTALLIYKGGQI